LKNLIELTSGKLRATLLLGSHFGLKNMKDRTNSFLYAYYYWWLSEEGEAGERLFRWLT
jgi:hypothetical protein